MSHAQVNSHSVHSFGLQSMHSAQAVAWCAVHTHWTLIVAHLSIYILPLYMYNLYEGQGYLFGRGNLQISIGALMAQANLAKG